MSSELISRENVDKEIIRLDNEVNAARKEIQYNTILLSIHDLDVEAEELEKLYAKLRREFDLFRSMTKEEIDAMRVERVKLTRAIKAATDRHSALLAEKFKSEIHVYQQALNLTLGLIEETTQNCPPGGDPNMNAKDKRLEILAEVKDAIQEGLEKKYPMHPIRYKSTNFYYLLGEEDPDADNTDRKAVVIRYGAEPDHTKIVICIGKIAFRAGPVTYFRDDNGLSVSETGGIAYRGALNGRGERNGQGMCVYPSGIIYDGEWAKELRCGNGVCTFINGDRYEGTYAKDARESDNGLLIFANGDRYTGEFRTDIRQGHGILDTAAGAHYEGEFQNNEREGHGRCEYPDGTYYEGEWHDDAREGQGQLVDSVGGRYEGGWRQDMKHGDGSVHFPDGVRYDGLWKNGDRRGQATAFTVPQATVEIKKRRPTAAQLAA